MTLLCVAAYKNVETFILNTNLKKVIWYGSVSSLFNEDMWKERFVSVGCRVPWKPGGLDTECEEHEAYLSKFRETASSKLQALINRSLEEEPEIKARNKTVQVGKYA